MIKTHRIPSKRLPALICAAILISGAPAAGHELTIASAGGAYQESQRKAFMEPFIAEGNSITEDEYNGEIAKIRAMVEAGSVSWDVVDADSQTVLAGCAEGLFEKIDWRELGLDRSKFIGGDFTDCAVPNILYSTVIAYSADVLKDEPTGLQDLFDLARFPGKRALQKSPFVNLEWALIADGVPLEDIYQVLATPQGVDRAFAKLDTIKSQVIWWEAGAEPPQLLASGDAAIVSAWSGRIYNAVKRDGKNFITLWDHQALDWDWWVMPKGTPRLQAAKSFIAFASDAKRMANQTNYYPYGPANRDAIAYVDPAILPFLPSAPENMTTAFQVDAYFWADHGEELRQRFSNWLAR